MIPNNTQHNPDPDYLRLLIYRVRMTSSDISIGKIADTLGIDRSQFRAYLIQDTKSSYRKCPYTTQYALEQWADHAPKNYYDVTHNAQLLLGELVERFDNGLAFPLVSEINEFEAPVGLKVDTKSALNELIEKQIISITKLGFITIDEDHVRNFLSKFAPS